MALISASFRGELALGLLDFLQKTSRKVPYSVGREQPAELRNFAASSRGGVMGAGRGGEHGAMAGAGSTMTARRHFKVVLVQEPCRRDDSANNANSCRLCQLAMLFPEKFSPLCERRGHVLFVDQTTALDMEYVAELRKGFLEW